MPVTMQDVLAKLDSDEPDYAAITALGADALPHLEMIVDADDGLRAAKAAYAVSLIGGAGSADVLRKAAVHSDPQVRIAVAHGVRSSGDDAGGVLEGLLDDADVGVRKVAIGAAGDLGRADLRDKIAAIAADDPHDFLRKAAADTVRTIA